MLWFVRQSLVLLVLAWALGLGCGFLLFGRRRGWAEPVTDVIPVIAGDEGDADGTWVDESWVDEGWVAADADTDLRAAADGVAVAWGPVGDDWDAVPAHHDYADPVWAAEAGITDDLLARQVDAVTEPAADALTDAGPAVAATPVEQVPPVDPFVRPLPTAADPVPVPRAAVPEPAPVRAPEPRLVASQAATGGTDDLTRIDGVTAEIATALRASGLRTFTAVARATTGDLRAALSAAGLAPTFKAAYWPLIAGDLVHAALAEKEAAAAAPADELDLSQEAAPAPTDDTADDAADDATDDTTDDTADDTAGAAAEVDAAADGDAVTTGPQADGSADDETPTAAAADVTLDVTDAASSPVDVTDAVVGAVYRVDDLERIDGVTLKIAAALRDAGITTFAEVADAPHARLRQALTAAGLRIAPSLQTWGAQARRLAAESDAALAARITAGDTGARL